MQVVAAVGIYVTGNHVLHIMDVRNDIRKARIFGTCLLSDPHIYVPICYIYGIYGIYTCIYIHVNIYMVYIHVPNP